MKTLYSLQGMPGMYDGWYHNGHFWGMHVGWWIFWIVLVGVIVWVFSRSTAGRGPGPNDHPSRDDPEEILRRRFAAGDIDRDEYEDRLRELRKT